jgi:hypothetical protein
VWCVSRCLCCAASKPLLLLLQERFTIEAALLAPVCTPAALAATTVAAAAETLQNPCDHLLIAVAVQLPHTCRACRSSVRGRDRLTSIAGTCYACCCDAMVAYSCRLKDISSHCEWCMHLTEHAKHATLGPMLPAASEAAAVTAAAPSCFYAQA